MSLKSELLRVLPLVLPKSPETAINGTKLLELVKPQLNGTFEDSSIRQYFSDWSGDSTTPIAKVDQGQGYYLRVFDSQPETGEESDAAIAPDVEGESPESGSDRNRQREEKFRAIFMRYARLTNRFPMKVEHTEGAKRSAGVNKWKFPDVIILDWEVGELTDSGFQLEPEMLDVKRSLGEQPFRLSSVELKTELKLGDFRQNFFQCVSNSKWAHTAVLAVAGTVSDKTLAEELRRLGSSYDVSVVTYGLDDKFLDECVSADQIDEMNAAEFEEKISGRIRLNQIITGRSRDVLDWDHLTDMRKQSSYFKSLFQWIAHCLLQVRPYTFEQFQKLQSIENEAGAS